MRFEAVLFDLGDILYDASVWRKWLANELAAAGAQITYPELVARWEELLVDVYGGRAAYWDRFRQLLDDLPLNESEAAAVTTAAAEKAREVERERQPLEGVPETLAALAAQNIRMAVLSDNEAGEEGIRSILRQLGIEQHFSAVVSSADIGFVKPSRQAYLTGVDALHSTPSQCVFVGHDRDELEGAQDAGLFVVSFNCSADLPADVHLERFSQLPAVVS